MKSLFTKVFLFALFAGSLSLGFIQGQIPDDDDPVGNRTDRQGEQTMEELSELAARKCEEAMKARDTMAYVNHAINFGKSFATLGNSGKAMGMFHQALPLAELADFSEGVAHLKLEIGVLHYNNSQFDPALRYFLAVRGIAARSGLKQLEAETLNYIGKYYHSKALYDQSLKYYEQSLAMAEKIQDTLRLASVLNNIGKHFITQGDIADGLEMCLRSLRLQEVRSINEEVLATTCNHLGNIYADREDYERALFYHRKALEVRKSIQYKEGIGKSYLNLGRLFYQMGRSDSAIYYSKKATGIFQTVNYTKGGIKALLLEGQICLGNKDLSRAGEFFEQAKELSLETGYVKGLVRSGIFLGNKLLLQGQPQYALEEYKNSLERAQKNGITDAVRDCYKGMQQCFEMEQMYREAYACAVKYNEINEDMLKSEYGSRIASLEVHFETMQSRRTSELLRVDNKLKNSLLKRKNQLIVTGILILVLLTALIGVLFSLYRYKNRDNIRLKELNRELQQVSSEKDRMFSIIAHELRNPLWWFRNITETLSQRFDIMEKQKLNETLIALNESAQNTFLLMDNLLNWSRSKLNMLPFHPADFEPGEVIGLNLSQFKGMASQKGITIIPDLQHTGLVHGDREQFNIVIRNLLSNAVKFTPSGGTVTLSTRDHKGGIQLLVRDTGIGIDPGMIRNLFDESKAYSTLGLMQEKGAGLGLKICREFSEKNGGSLEVHSTLNNGTTIEVIIRCPTIKPDPLIMKRNRPVKRSRQKKGLFKNTS